MQHPLTVAFLPTAPHWSGLSSSDRPLSSSCASNSPFFSFSVPFVASSRADVPASWLFPSSIPLVLASALLLQLLLLTARRRFLGRLCPLSSESDIVTRRTVVTRLKNPDDFGIKMSWKVRQPSNFPALMTYKERSSQTILKKMLRVVLVTACVASAAAFSVRVCSVYNLLVCVFVCMGISGSPRSLVGGPFHPQAAILLADTEDKSTLLPSAKNTALHTKFWIAGQIERLGVRVR